MSSKHDVHYFWNVSPSADSITLPRGDEALCGERSKGTRVTGIVSNVSCDECITEYLRPE